MQIDVRSVFISDHHIGYKGADLSAAVDFLRHVKCKYLFLNGDIVDTWKLEKAWQWPDLGTALFTEIAIKHLTGTKVIYLPGNHDDLFRHIDVWEREVWARRLGFKIRNTYMHKGPNGERWLVLHGDQFDAGILRAGLSRWSDKLWVEISRLLPVKLTLGAGGRVFSLASELTKKAGKKALAMLNRFENAALRRARIRNAIGVICGHTHMPVIKTLAYGIIYANSGTWQGAGKNHALIEAHDGTMSLMPWPVETGAAQTADPETLARATRTALLIKRWIARAVRRSLSF